MRHNARAWANDALEMLGYPNLSVRIEWNERFTARMGDASYRIAAGPRIRLSSPLWPLAGEAERRETVIHEICHIVAFHESFLSGKRIKAHGSEWKSKMRACGLEPLRCHKIDVSKAPGSRRKMKIYCACDSPHMVSAKKYNKVLCGINYKCKQCGGRCRAEPYPPIPKKPRVKPVRTVKAEAYVRISDWLRKAKDK